MLHITKLITCYIKSYFYQLLTYWSTQTKGDLHCNKKKLLTLPFCDELFVILEIYCEGMFIYMRPVDGEAYIIANVVLFDWHKYELVDHNYLLLITKFQISFQQQSASRNEQQVNFLFWTLPLACFWSIRTI